MALVEKFEDMEGWKKARILCKKIYEITSRELFYKDYALKDQIRRSAISIMGNIAEGFERNSKLQKNYFLNIAIGSSGETKSQLYIAKDQLCITEEEFNYLSENANEISRIINGFIQKNIRKS